MDKGVIYSLCLVSFIVFLAVDLSFLASFGDVATRLTLGDYTFHRDNMLNGCLFSLSCRYSPLLYVLSGAGLLDVRLSLAVFSCALLFLLLPWAVFRFSRSFLSGLGIPGGEELAYSAVFFYLFGSVFSLVVFTAFIIPQALALFFVLLGLSELSLKFLGRSVIIRDPRGLLRYFGPWYLFWFLASLSHREGFIVYAVASGLFLFPRFLWVFLVGLAVVLFSRRLYVIPALSLIEVLGLWVNPVLIWLAARGLPDLGNKNGVLFFPLVFMAFCVLVSPIDENFRPILFSVPVLAPLLALGSESLSEKRKRILYSACLLIWSLVAAYCLFSLFGYFVLDYRFLAEC